MQLRYNFRLYPTPAQEGSLANAFGSARVVFNDALAARRAAHAAGNPFIPATALQKRVITEAKKTEERSWLADAPVDALIQALRDLDTAYRNFFSSLSGKRKGPKVREPRFRSRKDNRQTLRFTRNGFRLRPNGSLNLAKVGDVEVRWSRDLPSAPSSVTVIKDAAGRYFCSFVVMTDGTEVLPEVDAEVGIDLGLTHFAVLDDGTKVTAPKFLRRAARKLRKAQRSLCRKQKGSQNRKKAVVRVAKTHAKVADSRRDWHHKLSTTIIRENQLIAVEDLAVSGLGRTRLAKSVYDAGWSTFTAMLEYKAARYGHTFVKVDRFFPSSQVCSDCGVKDGPKPLATREWTCNNCGARHDRDTNAARNIIQEGKRIVAAGQADTQNGRGAQVRPGAIPAQRDEAATHPGDLLTPASARVGDMEGIPTL
ncbi:RNA-guided endonuclease InsQ/TnpB family protein [Streptacidiphilus sp. N1-3]|uniref:RNA-guided endonuclease InsQ/TnpB family protein n=1 Tax=Streptacidiphilus alkalitolerans TaxID=3342712 RepID=A0ABV6WTL5_9ACTN